MAVSRLTTVVSVLATLGLGAVAAADQRGASQRLSERLSERLSHRLSHRLSQRPIAITPLAAPSAVAPDRALIDTYCVTCHNQRLKTGGLALDALDLADVSKDARVWEEAVRKLRGGLMPPVGAKRPDSATVVTFVSALEGALDRVAAAHPNPGRVSLHRLNRAEYASAIEDLLGVRVNAAALLPKDDESDGFENVATALTVSPSFLDQYISAARVVTSLALGNASARPGSATYRPARGTDQAVRVDGLPLGTRGGLVADHLFPADGEYKLNISGLAIAGYVRGMEYRHALIVTVDGVKVFTEYIGGEEDMKAIDQKQAAAVAAISDRFQGIPLTMTAGPHRIGVTFVARTYAESDEVLHSFRPGVGEERIPKVGSIEIQGPFTTSGLSSTPSRQRIFICRPATTAEELPCATRILSSMARRAFRRPVTEADIAPLARSAISTRASARRCRRFWRAPSSSSAPNARRPPSPPGPCTA
jgi:mono/diheme cytochrome c family protein